MTLQDSLAILDRLPGVVAELHAISAAADELTEIEYAGAGAVANEIEEALECLDGAPGALLYLAGLKHAGGDVARFEKWDAGLAGRMNLRELP
jgi:hypothetical protein